MKKILKIILIAFIVVIVAVVASFSLIAFDAAGNSATDTHPLPNGDPVGKALVVYNPGLSGGAKDVATKIGYNLQESGYDVVLAGVKSSTASDLTGYDVIIVGGPIYAGKAASTVQAYLSTFSPSTDAIVGVFGYGSVEIDNTDLDAVMQEVAPLPSSSTVSFSAAIKVTNTDDIDARCQEFVTNLLV